MKLKPILWILIIIAAAAGAYFIMKNKVNNQDKKIQKLESSITLLKQETVPIKYKILNKKGTEMTVSVKFFDLDGKQIGKPKHYTLKGHTVSFDFIVVKFNNGYIAFPTKIFTDMIKPKDGTPLFDAYEINDYPMIYNGSQVTKDFKSGIKYIYQKIKSNNYDDLNNVFGNMVQLHPSADSVDKNDDLVYKIIVHTKGGIEIRED